MEFIAPVNSDFVKSDFKFIPAHMPYDKSIPNTTQKYVDLLHEQNLYLKNYEDFRIGVSIKQC
eukprot:8528328-Ditylum_brightwellii.AAC.1